MTFTNEEIQAMNAAPKSTKAARQTFPPNRNNATRCNTARGNPPQTEAAANKADQPIATLQSTTTNLQDAIGSIAGYSAQSTEALATQRDVIADRVAAQMAALLDPDLFLQEVMERTVAKLNQRTVEIPNFFDITLELPPTPKVRQLSATPESAP
jgi:ABC-type transporter Mla subunit MlaD